MPSNLFFISFFTLILLIINFYFGSFCVIDFFSRFYPFAFNLLGNELRSFSICVTFDLMTQITNLKVNTVRHLFFFNFFSIILSRSHDLGHGF